MRISDWSSDVCSSDLGEIAIAKRIEAGREMMIGGICESPLTMRALVAWRDQPKEGGILLRDVIDLEATYGAETDPSAAAAAPAGDELGRSSCRESVCQYG